VAASAVAVAAAAVAAGGVSAHTQTPAAHKAQGITVWLQVDAQQAWPQQVAAATSAFQQQHPGVDVNVEYQQWSDHLTKFDAALSGNTAPDVVELGNTETTKYMAAGAFAPLQGSAFPTSGTWLKGLKDSCSFGGKLYCVPYYAGARGVIYRTDLYKKAGIKSVPKSLDQFVADAQKLMAAHKGDKSFSAVYFPGKYWYAAMSFVYDFGGKIAVQSGGKWKGSLSSPQAQAGLTKWKQIVSQLSRASKTGDELKQDQTFAQGHVASIIANGWEWGVILDKKQGDPSLASKLGAYPMPGRKPGTFMPTFLGGSDLGVPVTSANKALAVDWIKAFTSATNERALASGAGVIPNTTTLLTVNKGKPNLAPFAAAANFSWFVPTAPNWADVESANVLPDMLVQIATGKKSVADAAKAADGKLTAILNKSS